MTSSLLTILGTANPLLIQGYLEQAPLGAIASSMPQLVALQHQMERSGWDNPPKTAHAKTYEDISALRAALLAGKVDVTTIRLHLLRVSTMVERLGHIGVHQLALQAYFAADLLGTSPTPEMLVSQTWVVETSLVFGALITFEKETGALTIPLILNSGAASALQKKNSMEAIAKHIEEVKTQFHQNWFWTWVRKIFTPSAAKQSAEAWEHLDTAEDHMKNGKYLQAADELEMYNKIAPEREAIDISWIANLRWNAVTEPLASSEILAHNLAKNEMLLAGRMEILPMSQDKAVRLYLDAFERFKETGHLQEAREALQKAKAIVRKEVFSRVIDPPLPHLQEAMNW